MRTLIALARQHQEVLSRQIRGYTELAVANETSLFRRHAESAPDVVPWTKALSQFQPTKVTTLPNGMRVATEVVPHSENSAVGVYIDAGSRYETDANNGVAHFLEHLIFKGTERRTVGGIEVEVENMGANLNAYTSREQTAYHARCLGSDVPQSIDLLGDIIINSKLSESSINRERDVIMREAQEIDGMVEEVCFDHLHATAFQHTPLGRTILGPTSNIKSMTKDDVDAYVRTHYTAGRMVLAAAGDVDHDAVVSAAEKAFASLPADSTSARDLIAAEPSAFTGSMVSVRDPDVKQTALAIAFQGVRWLDADSVVLHVMQQMLGVWHADSGTAHHQRSSLARAVASNGLADRVMAFNTNYHDSGLFGVYAQTSDASKLEDLSWAIMHEMTKLCYEVDEGDLQMAKNAAKASLLGMQSTSNGICEDIGRQLLVYGRRLPHEEMFARIDAVTGDTVRQVASKIIQDQDLAVSAVGELSFLPDYNWYRRRTYWNRY